MATTHSTTTSRTPTTDEPAIRLPSARLFGAVAAATLGVALAWAGVSAVLAPDSGVLLSGLLGVAVVGVVSLGGVFVMTPWKTRPVGVWMSVWMGGSVFRLLLTPLAVYLLYSAASPDLAVRPLGLAVGLAYLATLLTEAVVLASSLKKALPA